MSAQLKIDQQEFITIKRAKWPDMRHVIRIIRSSASWYKSFINERDIGEHLVDIQWAHRNFFKREFYVGYKGNEPVGILSFQEFKKFAYLGYIYLDIDFVGMGFGQKFMQFARNRAMCLGLEGMALLAHPNAVWATKAYKKFGFELVGKNKSEVLTWNQGILKSYYEEGFQLYFHTID